MVKKDQVTTTLRLSTELHKEIRNTAFEKGISLNQEIITRLAEYQMMVDKMVELTLKAGKK